MNLLIKTKPTLLHLGAPLNGSSFKRVHCTPFCYSRNVSLCESLWLSYFENITIFWSFHSFRIFVIMIALYPIPIVFLKRLGSLLECLLVCDRFDQKQADGCVLTNPLNDTPLRPDSTFIDGFSWAIHQKIADFNSYPLRYQFWKSVYKCWTVTQWRSV